MGTSVASAQNAIETSDGAKRLLDTARQINGLSSPGLRPWHIKATFQRYSRSGSFIDRGTFEALWNGPGRSKFVYISPSFSQVQYSSHGGTFVTGDHGDPPGLLVLIWWLAISHYRESEQVSRLGATLHRESIKGIEQDCVELGKGPAITRYDRETDALIDPASDISTPPDSYCFDEHQILKWSSRTINNFSEKIHASFRSPVEFDHRTIARDLDLELGGILGLSAHIESIEPLRDSSDADFRVPPEARELGNEEFRFSDLSGSVPQPELVSVSPEVAARQVSRRTSVVYPPEAKAAGIEGTVVLKARINKLGVVASLQVVSGPEVLRQAAVDAVRSWVYRPYTINGSPLEMDTKISVKFEIQSLKTNTSSRYLVLRSYRGQLCQ